MTTCNSDGFAPDPVLSKGLTHLDMTDHVQAFGRTSSAITFKPFSGSWAQTKTWQQFQGRWAKAPKVSRRKRNDAGVVGYALARFPRSSGSLVLDGMGSLTTAADFANTKAGRRLWWNVYKCLSGDTATKTWRRHDEAAEVQARWDQNRMEHRTAPALAPSRRSGRL